MFSWQVWLHFWTKEKSYINNHVLLWQLSFSRPVVRWWNNSEYFIVCLMTNCYLTPTRASRITFFLFDEAIQQEHNSSIKHQSHPLFSLFLFKSSLMLVLGKFEEMVLCSFSNFNIIVWKSLCAIFPSITLLFNTQVLKGKSVYLCSVPCECLLEFCYVRKH